MSLVLLSTFFSCLFALMNQVSGENMCEWAEALLTNDFVVTAGAGMVRHVR